MDVPVIRLPDHSDEVKTDDDEPSGAEQPHGGGGGKQTWDSGSVWRPSSSSQVVG